MNPISHLLFKRFTGRLTEAERSRLEQWISESPLHRRAADRLANPGYLTRENRLRSMVDTDRAEAEMMRRIAVSETPRRRRRILAAAAAAVLLAGVAVGILTYRPSLSAPDTTIADARMESAIVPGKTKALLRDETGKSLVLTEADTTSGQTFFVASPVNKKKTPKIKKLCLEVPRGGEFKVKLEDSTEVWLNAESTLRYPEKFDGRERRVEITGEAYFAVHHEPDRPFYVIAGGQQVRVYGTTFNVRNYADEEKVYTTLETGSISLSRLDGDGGNLFLSPGHQAVFDKADSRVEMKVVDPKVITGWRHGRFVFEEQPLRNIMRELSRWYDFEYEFADDSLGDVVFLGSIPRYTDFVTAVTILENCGNIRFEITDRKVLITSSK